MNSYGLRRELSVAFDSMFDMTVMVEREFRDGPETGVGAGLSGSYGSAVGSGQAVHPLLGQLDAACDRVRSAAAAALWSLSDADLESAIAGCERLRAQVHHVELGLIAEADGRALGTRLGAASTVAWLRHRFRIRPGHAKSLVHTANAVADRDDGEVVDYAANVSRRTGRELGETGAALAEGVISPEHAATVDKIMSKVPREVGIDQAVQAEADLAGFCRQFDPGTVARLGDYMLEMMRTDTLDDEDEHRHRQRHLSLDEHTGGISGQLTRDGLATLRSALDPLAAPNPAADGEPDLRTPGQRLADALVELARRALASDGFTGNHGMSHRVMVTIGLDSLTGTADTDPDAGSGSDTRAEAASPSGESTPGEATGTHTGGSGEPHGDENGAGEATGPHTGRSGEPHGDAGNRTGEPSGTHVGGSGAAADRGVHGANSTGAASAAAAAAGTAAEGERANPEPARSPGRHTIPAGWWIDRPLPSWATRDNGGIAPAQLEWGSLISASTALRLACHASVQRVLLDPAGAVLDVGRERRTVTPAQYAALIARDGGCAFPGCTRPPAWCIAHHIIHWAHGGPTALDNLVMLCGHHHRVIHYNGWRVHISDHDRLATFVPPRWIDPDQRPRRNNRPRHTGGEPRSRRPPDP